MEIRQLKTFKRVAEEKSFSKAAVALNYGQSTVTEHVKALEEELGVSLFDRLSKRIFITSAGEELYHYTVELLEIIEKINHISAGSNSFSGQIAIGVSESVLVYQLTEVLSGFKEKYPDVGISLMSQSCAQLKERLKSGQLDLIITLEPVYSDADYTVEVLSREQLVFVASIDYNVDAIEMLEQKDDKQENFIFSEGDCFLRKSLQNYLFMRNISAENAYEFSSIEAIKQCVISGLGISLLPLFCVKKLIDNNIMKEIKTCDDDIYFAVQMAHHKNKWISPIMKAFMSECREVLNSMNKEKSIHGESKSND